MIPGSGPPSAGTTDPDRGYDDSTLPGSGGVGEAPSATRVRQLLRTRRIVASVAPRHTDARFKAGPRGPRLEAGV